MCFLHLNIHQEKKGAFPNSYFIKPGPFEYFTVAQTVKNVWDLKENIALSEVNKIQKDKCHLFLRICES